MPSAELTERYSRQILYPGIGAEGQQKLEAAHVAIVGCGATGAAAAGLLARAGVGTLTLIDRDFVEESNLQRQVLFDEADAREALRGGIRGVVEMYAAHRDVLRVLSSMALLDAIAVGGAIQRMEQGRAGGMARLARRLADQEALRADVTADQAADLLWLLTSFDSFDLLHTGRDLSIEKTATTLITTADRSLCR